MNHSEYIHALHKCKQQPYVIMTEGHKLCRNILADIVNMARLASYSEQKVSSLWFNNCSPTVWQNKFFALGSKVIWPLFVTRVCLIIVIRFPQEEQMQTYDKWIFQSRSVWFLSAPFRV